MHNPLVGTRFRARHLALVALLAVTGCAEERPGTGSDGGGAGTSSGSGSSGGGSSSGSGGSSTSDGSAAAGDSGSGGPGDSGAQDAGSSGGEGGAGDSCNPANDTCAAPLKCCPTNLPGKSVCQTPDPSGQCPTRP